MRESFYSDRDKESMLTLSSARISTRKGTHSVFIKYCLLQVMWLGDERLSEGLSCIFPFTWLLERLNLLS